MQVFDLRHNDRVKNSPGFDAHHSSILQAICWLLREWTGLLRKHYLVQIIPPGMVTPGIKDMEHTSRILFGCSKSGTRVHCYTEVEEI